MSISTNYPRRTTTESDHPLGNDDRTPRTQRSIQTYLRIQQGPVTPLGSGEGSPNKRKHALALVISFEKVQTFLS